MEPSALRFTTQPAKSCKSCLFDGERSPVCHKATAVAIRAGLADFDAGFVYIAVEADPRQLELLKGPA
jgi:hypothetical protein